MVYKTEILPEKTTSEISWILTMQLFLMFFLSQPIGLGIDMFGPRGILVPSLVFSVGGLIALSYATEYYQVFLAQSLCFGLGAAGAFVCGLVVAGQYFEKKRALAIGIVSTGGSSGEVSTFHRDRFVVIVFVLIQLRGCCFPHNAGSAIRRDRFRANSSVDVPFHRSATSYRMCPSFTRFPRERVRWEGFIY